MLLPLQSWISITVQFPVPLQAGPTHLLVLVFIAIFQFVPLARMANFCAVLVLVPHCWTAVPLFVEP